MESSRAKLLNRLKQRRVRRFPILARFGDADQQDRAFVLAKSDAITKSRFERFVIPCLCAAVVVLVMEYFRIDSLFLLPGIVIVTFIVNHRLNKRIRAALMRRLEGDIWCHQCQYLLHDNTSGRCPECGKEIPDDQRHWILTRRAMGVDVA